MTALQLIVLRARQPEPKSPSAREVISVQRAAALETYRRVCAELDAEAATASVHPAERRAEAA